MSLDDYRVGPMTVKDMVKKRTKVNKLSESSKDEGIRHL